MEIPQNRRDFINQVASANGIPVEDMLKWYQKKIEDPALIAQFSSPDALLDYADQVLSQYIQDYHSGKLTDLELFVIVSQTPWYTKAGSRMNIHTGLAKRPDDKKVKWITITNMEDSEQCKKLPGLCTGIMGVNIAEETDTTITAFSRPNGEFIAQPLSWIKPDMESKRAYIRKLFKHIEIKDAPQNITPKDTKGYNVPFHFVLIRAVLARVSVNLQDDGHGGQRESCPIKLTDKSTMLMPQDFFKDSEITDPKDPSKKKKVYGGFGGFAEADDVRELGKGSEVEVICQIEDAHNCKPFVILPITTIAPKKATDRLQTGKPASPQTPPVNAPSAASV